MRTELNKPWAQFGHQYIPNKLSCSEEVSDLARSQEPAGREMILKGHQFRCPSIAPICVLGRVTPKVTAIIRMDDGKHLDWGFIHAGVEDRLCRGETMQKDKISMCHK